MVETLSGDIGTEPTESTQVPIDRPDRDSDLRIDDQQEASGLSLVAEAETYLALVQLVKQSLGLVDLTEETLREVATQLQRSRAVSDSVDRVSRLLDERQAEVDALKSELELSREQYESMQVDERIAADRASKLEDEARWLRGRLADNGDNTGAFGLVPDEAFTTYPNDFDDLHSRIKDLEAAGVVFTGDGAFMRGLDEHDTLGKLVATAWDALLVLVDYLRARREGVCETNVKQYLLHTPQGYRAMSLGKFGEGETKATMERFGNEREFAVPESAHESGTMRMEAHFKLGKVGMVSPRLYYVDCYSTTGQIYVGYIGPHLTNTMTN